ncbi:oligopeptide/dipeptide ABC transporter ATP-binding protein [Microbacterium resistens]|uniref:Oligopeptide/dipeptide ABC transporter ATP-binding protein n=1 Tax=Microbacterium resistens TaxID=156977 RepID=A0ABU1S9F9_9MICO|nr:ABC transporter ATP-binding protein [Microbacterium resistens]MDR6866229.1 oligopeptide/dipeptide ABC transporter ATP-binding protein [Microbacterium resistens]
MDQEGVVLEVERLTVRARGKETPLVDGVSFEIRAGETVGLVGESGSGKSLTSMATLRLLADSLQVDGDIRLAGEDVVRMSPRRLREVRGTAAAVIFQEPMSSLNPVLTVQTQLFEALRGMRGAPRAERRAAAIRLLDQVGITEPAQRLRQYPHELSGGMCQRIMIAIALAGRPRLLIADEPTTALDVTIQAQVLDLLKTLCRDLGMGLLLVTHDLGVVAQNCDRVNVMYAGRIVESGTVGEVFTAPRHPYTKALFASLPPIEGEWRRLPSLAGSVPTLDLMPTGCRFHPRCPVAIDRCAVEVPVLAGGPGRSDAACWVIGADDD